MVRINKLASYIPRQRDVVRVSTTARAVHPARMSAVAAVSLSAPILRALLRVGIAVATVDRPREKRV
jgi:hypothetical protein